MVGRESLVSAAIVAFVGLTAVSLTPPVAELMRADPSWTPAVRRTPVVDRGARRTPAQLEPTPTTGTDSFDGKNRRRRGSTGRKENPAEHEVNAPIEEEGVWIFVPASGAGVLLCRPADADHPALSDASLSTVRQLRPALVVASSESKY